MINYNGKEYKKECIYICKLNHFAIQKKLTEYCKSNTLQFKKSLKMSWEVIFFGCLPTV